MSKNGKMIRSYTPEETKAILRYKHDSRDIHNILRYNKSIKNEKEVKNSIEHLTNIFNTHKTEIAHKDIIAYRALDKNALKQTLTNSGYVIKSEEKTIRSGIEFYLIKMTNYIDGVEENYEYYLATENNNLFEILVYELKDGNYAKVSKQLRTIVKETKIAN